MAMVTAFYGVKTGTLFWRLLYSNIRRGAIQIYIPTQKYETFYSVRIYIFAPNTTTIAKIKNTKIYI